MTHTIYADGYNYQQLEDGTVLAVSLKTGEVTEARHATIPAGSVIMTPEDIAAQIERKRQQQEFFLQRKSNEQLGKFFFLAAKFCNPFNSFRHIDICFYLVTNFFPT